MRLWALALMAVLLTARPAAAQLSAVDLVPGSGDGKITYDAATGLYWLDLTQTLNLSVPDVLGGAGGWIPSGWRYATPGEICGLFASYAIAVASCGGATGSSASGDHLLSLQQYLGLTLDNGINRGTWGFYDDGGDPGRVGIARLTYQVTPDQSDVLVQNSATSAIAVSTYGNWLVRNTAVPVATFPYEVP